MSAALEARIVLGRIDAKVGLGVFAVTVALTGFRSSSGPITEGGSILTIASSDDRTWYLPILASAVLGSVASSAFFAAGTDALSWTSGRTRARQVAARLRCCGVLGLLCGCTYWLLRVGVAALVGHVHHRSTNHAQPPVLWHEAARLTVVCVPIAGLGGLVGAVTRNVAKATAMTAVLFGATLPLLDAVATRFPQIVAVASYLPGGATTTVLESNGGIAVSSGLINLKSGRSAFGGAAILLAWSAALIAVQRLDHHRAANAATATRRLGRSLLLSVLLVLAGALAVPPLARSALPWYLDPTWLHDTAHHRSSLDVTATFIADLRSGRAPTSTVDPHDSVWRPLRRGIVSLPAEHELQAPDSVLVRVTDRGGDAWSYTFGLAREHGRWEVARVSADLD